MCGIIGILGKAEVAPLLIDGLKRLEYRGYDSAGIATLHNGHISRIRAEGKLVNLAARLDEMPLAGTTGIGHTRWATHGAPSDINSHPHTNTEASVAVVHNGIIENYIGLRAGLLARGHTFASETDTEVLPHLIEAERAAGAPTWLEAIRRALARAEGAYALGIVCADDPDTLYAARHGSPLIIGCGNEGRTHLRALRATDVHRRSPLRGKWRLFAGCHRNRAAAVSRAAAVVGLALAPVGGTHPGARALGRVPQSRARARTTPVESRSVQSGPDQPGPAQSGGAQPG